MNKTIKAFTFGLTGSILALGVSMVAPQKAEARHCLPINHDAALCSDYIGQNEAGSALYDVAYVHGNKDVRFRVACRGNYARNWESYGHFTHSETETLAQYFCRLPG